MQETFEPLRVIDLTYLKFHWGSAYQIRFRKGAWYAARRDDGRILCADSTEQLLDRIRDDYARCKVARA